MSSRPPWAMMIDFVLKTEEKKNQANTQGGWKDGSDSEALVQA